MARLPGLVLAYAGVLFAFTTLRLLADDAGLPVHYAYAEAGDRLLFAGILPSAWLQKHAGVADTLFVGVYFTHFINTSLLALLLVLTRQSLLPRFVAAFCVMLAVSLAVHVLIPTAPPWIASDVPRLVAQSTEVQSVDGNLFAAMPSLHAGFAMLVAIVLAQYGKRWGLLGVSYVLAMGFSLTYLGEHYVIDSIAGIALAFGAWRFTTQRPIGQPRTVSHQPFAALR